MESESISIRGSPLQRAETKVVKLSIKVNEDSSPESEQKEPDTQFDTVDLEANNIVEVKSSQQSEDDYGYHGDVIHQRSQVESEFYNKLFEAVESQNQIVYEKSKFRTINSNYHSHVHSRQVTERNLGPKTNTTTIPIVKKITVNHKRAQSEIRNMPSQTLELPKIKNHYRGISGIKRIKEQKSELKAQQQNEIKYLIEGGISQFKIPRKHTSDIVDFTKGNTQIHPQNDETVQAISQNIRTNLQYSKNPYFNKKQFKTKHSEYLNPIALYKMGQLDESEVEEFIGSFGSITKIKAQKGVLDFLKKKQKTIYDKHEKFSFPSEETMDQFYKDASQNDSKELIENYRKLVDDAKIVGKHEIIEIIEPSQLLRINEIRHSLDHNQEIKEFKKVQFVKNLRKAMSNAINQKLLEQQQKDKISKEEDEEMKQLLQNARSININNIQSPSQAKFGGIYREQMKKIRGKKYKDIQRDPFEGMKWDANFVKKLYLIKEFGEKGIFYDKKRITESYFKFLEEAPNGQENAILKELRQKYGVSREDMSPFKNFDSNAAIADNIMSNEKVFEKVFDEILSKQSKKRNKNLKLSKTIEKNINYQSFAQGQKKNCCFSPIKLDSEILPNDIISNSVRTRTIMASEKPNLTMNLSQPRHNSQMQNYSLMLISENEELPRNQSVMEINKDLKINYVSQTIEPKPLESITSALVLTNLKSVDSHNEDYTASKNFSGKTKAAGVHTKKLTQIFNERFKEKTLRTHIQDYDKIEAEKSVKKLEKFMKQTSKYFKIENKKMAKGMRQIELQGELRAKMGKNGQDLITPKTTVQYLSNYHIAFEEDVQRLTNQQVDGTIKKLHLNKLKEVNTSNHYFDWAINKGKKHKIFNK